MVVKADLVHTIYLLALEEGRTGHGQEKMLRDREV